MVCYEWYTCVLYMHFVYWEIGFVTISPVYYSFFFFFMCIIANYCNPDMVKTSLMLNLSFFRSVGVQPSVTVAHAPHPVHVKCGTSYLIEKLINFFFIIHPSIWYEQATRWINIIIFWSHLLDTALTLTS